MLRLACATVAVLAAATTDPISDALAGVPFSDGLVGITNNADAYGLLPLACYYLETPNVTQVASSWGGECSVTTLLPPGPPPPPSHCTAEAPAHEGFDRPGDDYLVQPAASFAACSANCCADARCTAWVFVATLQATNEGSCAHNGPCCFLKAGVPAENPDSYPGGIWSGNVTQPVPVPVVVPPTGVRDAVPVGGLGAGTVELRGDGTLHELTMHSASPAGAAKYASQPDALFAYAVNGAGARAVRTSPPPYAVPGVSAISYSGTYPVSRLALTDPSTLGAADLEAALFAYHHLRPGDAPASAAPAAAFTLSVTNRGSSPANVSFMFQLPFGAMRDCRRVDFAPISAAPAVDYASCMHTCGAGCGAWSFDATSRNCTQLPSAGRMVYSLGSFCGVRGAWTSAGGVSLGLSMHPGDAPSEAGPAVGDIALRPVGAAGSVLSFAVSDDPAALYSAFAASPGAGFAPGNHGGVVGGDFTGVIAAHGAVAITSPMLAPGDTASVSIVWSWYFPNRDFYGRTIGQFYTTLFSSAVDVVSRYDADHLAAVAADAAAHTSVFAGAGAASLPAWLNDHMVNQFSHFRNFIFAADGTQREHEANDCPDLDSVHNDYQRHLPYLWAVPTFEAQKSALYEHCQHTSGPDTGMVTENPGFYASDGCGGRRMGDTTSLWLIELLEIYRHTANASRLVEAWPAAVRAVKWSIAMSADYGLPAHLECTYDILNMSPYNTTTFNGVLHLAMMKAAVALANDPAIGDAATAALAEAAYTRGVAAATTLLWNATHGFFRAFTGEDAIMADCLYGQQLALAHGLGWLLPQSMIASHLQAEADYNLNAFGLTVMTARHPGAAQVPAAAAAAEGVDSIAQRKAAKAADVRGVMQQLRARGDGQNDAVWMGGAPTWSCLAIALGPAGPAGGNLTAALEPTRRELENYRSRLHMMWDLTGLSTTDDWGSDEQNGQPFCTSHYGFMLTDYYLIYALSGQQTNLPAGALSFAPVFACPYSVPFGLMGREGTLSCDAAGKHTFRLAFGTLALPTGGLSVSGDAYPGAVTLAAGQSISW